MPLRLVVVYALLALIAAALGAFYLYLSRERRAYGRAVRAYRRARKAADKAA